MHFLRDMLGHVAKAQQPMIATAIRQVFAAASGAEARQRLAEVVERLAAPAPKVAALLEESEPDVLAFFDFPREHWSKLRSINPSSGSTARLGGARTSSASSPTPQP